MKRRKRIEPKTAALVTVVTLLIWIWAEGESLATKQMQTRLLFASDSPDLIIETDFEGIAAVTLAGPTNAIDDAEQLLLIAPLQLQPGIGIIPSEPGKHTIVLRDALRAQPDLIKTGVSVTEVRPSEVDIEVIRRVRIALPAVVTVPDGVRLIGEPTVEPDVVYVTCREEYANEVRAWQQVSITIDETQLRTVTPGQPAEVRGKVAPPETTPAIPVEFESRTSRVVLTLAANVDSYVLPTVPVWVSMPGTQSGLWRVTLVDPFVADVTVTGPSELIEQIRKGDLVIKARADLSSDDLEGGVTSKPVTFDAGLERVLKIELADREVRLEIQSLDLP